MERELERIKDGYHEDSLPIVIPWPTPANPPEPATDPRAFVARLRRFGLPNPRVDQACIDYVLPFEDNAWRDVQRLYSTELAEAREISRFVLDMINRDGSGSLRLPPSVPGVGDFARTLAVGLYAKGRNQFRSIILLAAGGAWRRGGGVDSGLNVERTRASMIGYLPELKVLWQFSHESYTVLIPVDFAASVPRVCGLPSNTSFP